MSRKKENKLTEIKPLPRKQMDFYRRIQKSPERIREKRKKCLLAAGVVSIGLAAAGWYGIQYQTKNRLQQEILELESYVLDEQRIQEITEIDSNHNQVLQQKEQREDLESVRKNVDSFPDITSTVFKTLETSDQVAVRITGYQASNGELEFDAVAPEVTKVSQVIENWRELALFKNVYFSGYSMLDTQDGYLVKVICELNEPGEPYEEMKNED